MIVKKQGSGVSRLVGLYKKSDGVTKTYTRIMKGAMVVWEFVTSSFLDKNGQPFYSKSGVPFQGK